MFNSYKAYTQDIMAAETTLKTIVFLGTVREGRMGMRVAKFIKQRLENAKHSVEIFGELIE